MAGVEGMLSCDSRPRLFVQVKLLQHHNLPLPGGQLKMHVLFLALEKRQSEGKQWPIQHYPV